LQRHKRTRINTLARIVLEKVQMENEMETKVLTAILLLAKVPPEKLKNG